MSDPKWTERFAELMDAIDTGPKRDPREEAKALMAEHRDPNPLGLRWVLVKRRRRRGPKVNQFGRDYMFAPIGD